MTMTAMKSVNNLTSSHFTGDAIFFRGALAPKCKKLILQYLKELKVYVDDHPVEVDEGAVTLKIIKVINTAIRHEVNKQSHVNHGAKSLYDALVKPGIYDLSVLIDIVSRISGQDLEALGALYPVIPKFPHWQDLPKVKDHYGIGTLKHLKRTEYHYCGYVRDESYERMIRHRFDSERIDNESWVETFARAVTSWWRPRAMNTVYESGILAVSIILAAWWMGRVYITNIHGDSNTVDNSQTNDLALNL
jgi:hypothetical protein